MYPDGRAPKGKLRVLGIRFCKRLRNEEECSKTRSYRGAA